MVAVVGQQGCLRSSANLLNRTLSRITTWAHRHAPYVIRIGPPWWPVTMLAPACVGLRAVALPARHTLQRVARHCHASLSTAARQHNVCSLCPAWTHAACAFRGHATVERRTSRRSSTRVRAADETGTTPGGQARCAHLRAQATQSELSVRRRATE